MAHIKRGRGCNNLADVVLVSGIRQKADTVCGLWDGGECYTPIIVSVLPNNICYSQQVPVIYGVSNVGI